MNNTVLLADEYILERIGLGTNRITDDDPSHAALKAALAVGMNFIDTAAAYTNGQSEEVIGKTLAPYPKNVLIATKGGMHAPDFHVDSSPKALALQLETSLKRLNLKTIPVYFLHRVDPNIPLKDSLLFLKQMQAEKKIKHIGLSEVTVDQIKEAQSYVDIVAVENQYNLVERAYDNVIDYAEEKKIVFIPWFPLGRGNVDTINEKLETFAVKYEATPTQIILAWLLKRSPIMLPIPGSLSPQHLQENYDALNITLSDEDFQLLSQK
jgi:pyridoxine 4-dehydrogenase